MRTPAERHVPVMLGPVLDLLGPVLTDGAVHVDGTLGMGGHAEAVLQRHPGVRVVAIDRDPLALDLAKGRLAPFADRVSYAHATNDELPEVLDDLGLDTASSMFFDLGVSSVQLDEPDRGFAYAQDAPLDMRMDPGAELTAADVLNDYDEREIARVLQEYGEERFARRIARAVVREREVTPFARSARLVELLRAAIPAAAQRSGGHPAKRTFQALRIEVNAELSVWSRAMPRALDRLAVGGRIAVLSFHSLEDRITKRGLTAGATSSAPADLPVELEEHAPELRLLTRGAGRADADELAANSRSASARLRAAERIRPPRTTPPGTGRTPR
ncbi:16S rRNA (cytosine(1402)-N(4))-methyltransferase RsmH [Marihabitans asiaticum]|uniref:Ribosomal RNA small subunit methyltransferase H n=1 Tax=Marihabitans asiaticum TaxID=415218 RepID=A0A560WA13_9MICO|nr:16S rRNA (cytosine(1402)-N(4))-methyltransferase RsmH [Marihabitans asiaticum]TWD14468.1 16S rRNA (cytosine1402-N4)-methyltransferase [Marihabitans asiaticum]